MSIAFLGENGADRVVVSETPRPILMGKVIDRILPAVGLVLHDELGSERGGIGYLGNEQGKGRAAVALDSPNVDAIGMMVDDATHTAQLMVNQPGHAWARS